MRAMYKRLMVLQVFFPVALPVFSALLVDGRKCDEDEQAENGQSEFLEKFHKVRQLYSENTIKKWYVQAVKITPGSGRSRGADFNNKKPALPFSNPVPIFSQYPHVMKRIFTCILVLSQFNLSAQCLLRELPLNQRMSKSSLIIEGKVLATESFWNETRSMIYTSNTIEVLKVFKGNTSASTIDVITPGGTVGLRRITQTPGLTLQKGEVGIFMCENVQRAKALPSNARRAPRFEVYGATQGFIKYDLIEGTASDPFKKYKSVKNELYKTFSPLLNYKVVKNFNIGGEQASTLRINSISGFTPTSITAGTHSVLTINGTAFGATPGSVQFSNADAGSGFMTALATQILSWSNTQITVEVPEGAGTGLIRVIQGASTFTSASALTVDWSHINPISNFFGQPTAYESDHANINTAGGYTFHLNTAFDANAPARASFVRALDTWRCGTGINWTIGSTTAVADLDAMDDISTVAFDNVNPLPGALGVCQTDWIGCIVGPSDIEWTVEEMDLLFEDGADLPLIPPTMTQSTWQFGPAAPTGFQYDFESVAVHELGHAHQLGHVIDAGAIMHYALFNGATARTLSANDLAAGNFVMGKNVVANLCVTDAMTLFAGCATLPLTIGSINASQQGHGVRVEWINESESNVHHYEVEESGNGSAFTVAATVAPTGNNNQRIAYEWFDAQVTGGSNFYRVKAIGHNGDVKFSSVVTVNFTSTNKTFNVYPNPVSGRPLTVAFNNLQKGTYTLSLFNAVGQRLFTKTLVHAGGNAVHNINVSGWAPGVYSVKLAGNHTNEKPIMLTIK